MVTKSDEKSKIITEKTLEMLKAAVGILEKGTVQLGRIQKTEWDDKGIVFHQNKPIGMVCITSVCRNLWTSECGEYAIQASSNLYSWPKGIHNLSSWARKIEPLEGSGNIYILGHKHTKEDIIEDGKKLGTYEVTRIWGRCTPVCALYLVKKRRAHIMPTSGFIEGQAEYKPDDPAASATFRLKIIDKYMYGEEHSESTRIEVSNIPEDTKLEIR